MKPTTRYLGVDVSLQHLDCCFSESEEKIVFDCENELSGWLALSRAMRQSDICVVEATGPYHIGLANFLYSQGKSVCVVNPLSVKYFARMQLRRAKTDKVDAYLLARYGQLIKPSLWAPSASQLSELRQLMSVSEQLIKQRVMLTNHRKALLLVPDFSKKAVSILDNQIQFIQEQVKSLQTDIDQLLQEHYAEIQANLKSIPGLGPKAVATLILITGGFSKFKNYKALIAYAGLAPRTYESGKSVKGPSHICKLGVAYLRKLLYQCAHSAKRFNPVCKALFERLRQKGKPFKVAMIAVVNKLIKLAFAIAKSGQKFDRNYQMQ